MQSSKPLASFTRGTFKTELFDVAYREHSTIVSAITRFWFACDMALHVLIDWLNIMLQWRSQASVSGGPQLPPFPFPSFPHSVTPLSFSLPFLPSHYPHLPWSLTT